MPEVTQPTQDEIMGKRLLEARRSRSYSQEEVSQQLGVSRPTLIAIEKGTRPAKPNELAAFARLYGVNIGQLLHTHPFLAGFQPQFRATQSAEVSQQAIDEATQVFRELCEDYIALENLQEAPLPRYAYPAPYPKSDPLPIVAEEIAQLERDRLRLGQGPLSQLRDILENEVGLRIFVAPLSEFRIAGMFYYAEDVGGCILINGTHPATRQLWTLAHEYAHFLVDRNRREVDILYDQPRKPASEQFADRLAAAFLMPTGALRQRFSRLSQERNGLRVADLCQLAHQYGVSVEALSRRLEALGCLAAGAWERHSKKVNLPAIQKQMGLTHTAENTYLPERYTRLAVQAFVEESLSESELARYLRCSIGEARETVEHWTYSNEVDDTGERVQREFDLNAPLTVPTERG